MTLDVPEVAPAVLADESRILQVLTNLLSNAMKFTRPGGNVTVSARPVDEEVIFAVKDEGPGIPSEDVPRLFDRFWHARRGQEGRGTGLGLAIAKGIVDAHGGRIWVETTAGVGSTFRFSLPRLAQTQLADRGDVAAPSQSANAVNTTPDQRFSALDYDRRPIA